MLTGKGNDGTPLVINLTADWIIFGCVNFKEAIILFHIHKMLGEEKKKIRRILNVWGGSKIPRDSLHYIQKNKQTYNTGKAFCSKD